jgi:3-dehydroquinate synthase
MATTTNPFSLSLSKNSADIFSRVPNPPNSVSLRSAFVSPGSSDLSLIRGQNSVVSASRVRSVRICASSAQVMDQSVAKTDSKVPVIVDVNLGDRSYPIYIGSGLLDQPHLLQR